MGPPFRVSSADSKPVWILFQSLGRCGLPQQSPDASANLTLAEPTEHPEPRCVFSPMMDATRIPEILCDNHDSRTNSRPNDVSTTHPEKGHQGKKQRPQTMSEGRFPLVAGQHSNLRPLGYESDVRRFSTTHKFSDLPTRRPGPASRFASLSWGRPCMT